MLESWGEAYLDAGHTVLDLFGAMDGEGLAWLRSKYKNEVKFLILHGENVEVTSAPCDTRITNKVTFQDLYKYDIIISASPLYSSSDDEFMQIGDLMNRIFYRRLSWKRLIYCIVREAANLYYSRLRATGSQTQAKANMIYLIRQSRHVGMALGMDTLRTKSVDIDIRELTDYLFFKTVGFYGLHKDFNFLYSFFDPYKMSKMPPSKNILLTQRGDIGVGHVDMIPWHKLEPENILNIVGIKVEYKEPIRLGIDRGGHKTIGDTEHAQIMKLYAEKGLSYQRIADKLGRSSRTPLEAVKRHNMMVKSSGYCPTCRRVEGTYETTLIVKNMIKQLEES